MIKGLSGKKYNDFEEELNSLAGEYGEVFGLAHYFDKVYQTFLEAEKYLLKKSNEYLADFEKEDYEIKVSMSRDSSHDIEAYPSVDLLRQSYFVTIHSEFEEIWINIKDIYNQFHTPITREKLNFNYLSKPYFNNNNLLDKVVSNNQNILSYNYIRNRFVHNKIIPTSNEFLKTKNYIDNGEIKNISIKQDSGKHYFVIENMDFAYTYSKKILSFIKDIINTSYSQRI